MKEKVLITGASGFLGSAIASEFCQNEYEVVGVVRSLENSWRLNDSPLVKVIASEVGKWEEIIQKESPHIVISADWDGTARDDRYDIELQLSNSQRITKIAKAAIIGNTKIFLHLGSQAEYGNNKEFISDYEKLNPQSPYAIAKTKLHNDLKVLFQKSTTKLIWARIFSVYGPKDINPSLINSVIESAMLRKEIQTSNGDQDWSYLYVTDFASAIRMVIESDLTINEVNIGNPKSVKIKEVLRFISSEVDKYNVIKIGGLTSPEDGWQSLKVNPKVLLSVGWDSKTTLEDGLASTINWWATQIEG